MKIRFQFLAEHADWIEHAILSVDVIMLNDRMEERVLRRNAHFARVDLHIFDILIVDLVALFRQHDATAVVETLNVTACDPDVNAANHHVAFLFGVDHRFVNTFHRRFKIDNLAFAHAARWRLPDSENFQRPVRTRFADDDANLRRPNFQTYDQIPAGHLV